MLIRESAIVCAVFVGIALDVSRLQAQDTRVLRREFDAHIDSQYKSNEPGGVVLVSRKGEVIYRRAFGMANIELNVPMPLDAVFCIASMTKQFTAVAVLQQVAPEPFSPRLTIFSDGTRRCCRDHSSPARLGKRHGRGHDWRMERSPTTAMGGSSANCKAARSSNMAATWVAS